MKKITIILVLFFTMPFHTSSRCLNIGIPALREVLKRSYNVFFCVFLRHLRPESKYPGSSSLSPQRALAVPAQDRRGAGEKIESHQGTKLSSRFSIRSMASSGQVTSHSPHPMHFSASIRLTLPSPSSQLMAPK